MQDATSGVHGPWARDVVSSSTHVLYSNASHAAGDSMRVQFSNDIDTNKMEAENHCCLR